MSDRSRVVVTGSAGVIGSVLRSRLPRDGRWEVVPFDLPHRDARERSHLDSALAGASAVVHLAWNTEIDNYRSDTIDPQNAAMALNVLQCALRAGVHRVVLASSVHADARPAPGGRATTSTPGVPDSPYGAHKLMVEALGRHFGTRGMEVVSLRFGGVNPTDIQPPPGDPGHAVWLSHRDCTNLVRACLDAPTVPNGSCCLYAVSRSGGDAHDLSNPFGWQPEDGLHPVIRPTVGDRAPF